MTDNEKEWNAEDKKFLMTSINSLNDSCHELHAAILKQREETEAQFKAAAEERNRQDERFNQLRVAMLRGIRELIEGMGD